MKKIALIFRMDITSPGTQPSPEQMEIYMAQWMEWINGISAKGQLAEGGNHLSPQGILLKHGSRAVNGPYAANKESVAGYILIHAKTMNEAVEIAKKCPLLNGENNSVEIRETATPGNIEESARS